MKNLLTPAGIEPATFRFVAQHLNHCATAVPHLQGGGRNFLCNIGINLPDYVGHCSSEDGGKNLLQNVAASVPYNTDLRATSL